MSARKQELLRAIEHLASVHHDWITSDATVISAELQQAIDATLAEFADGDIPKDCRKLFREADALATEWNTWLDVAVANGDPTAVPSIKSPVWAAMERLYDARKDAETRDPPPIETIQQLEKQGLNDKQICRIYGWWLAPKVEDIGKLQEERLKPGTHTGKDFVHPLLRRQQDDEQKRAVARAEFRKAQEEKLAKLEHVAPESVVDLVNQKLSAKQIGKMYGQSTNWVFRECERLGITPPPMDYDDPRTVRAPSEPALPESIARAMDAEQQRPTRRVRKTVEDYGEPKESPAGPVSVEDRVLAYANQGKQPEDIAAAMKADGEPVTPRRVEAILRQFGQTV